MDQPNISKKAQNSRARIVEAAYQLFLRQGYHRTSMRQISAEAGLTVGAIYNHFVNKEAIWEAVFMAKHPYREIMPLLKSVDSPTIAGFVRQSASHLVTELSRRSDLLNLMFIELVEFGGKHIPVLFQAIFPEAVQLGETLARKAGNLRPIPNLVLLRSFLGLFFSYYITEIMLPEEIRRQMGSEALDTFINIYLYGVLDEPMRERND